MHISWARLASFCHLGCHLGFISDPLIVSKFHNETHDPKGQENKIYTIVKGRETFYRRHTVPVTSCSEVKYVLKRVSIGSKDCTKEGYVLRMCMTSVFFILKNNININSYNHMSVQVHLKTSKIACKHSKDTGMARHLSCSIRVYPINIMIKYLVIY